MWKLAQRPQNVPLAFLKQCEFTLPTANISEDVKKNRDLLVDVFHTEMTPSMIDQVGMWCGSEL